MKFIRIEHGHKMGVMIRNAKLALLTFTHADLLHFLLTLLVTTLYFPFSEASHRTTTEFFEDKNQIDDLTLISLDAAYYLALAQSGVDPRCYVELR